MPNSYKELLIWQKAVSLAKSVYVLVQKLPRNEQYGISSQLCRAAVSIPSNIAEGQQRNGTREFIQFLSIAKGSLGELETQFIIVQDVYGLDCSDLLNEVTELQKMIFSISRKLSIH